MGDTILVMTDIAMLFIDETDWPSQIFNRLAQKKPALSL